MQAIPLPSKSPISSQHSIELPYIKGEGLKKRLVFRDCILHLAKSIYKRRHNRDHANGERSRWTQTIDELEEKFPTLAESIRVADIQAQLVKLYINKHFVIRLGRGDKPPDIKSLELISHRPGE